MQDRGLEKQRSRLGLSRRSTGIQKVSAGPAKSVSVTLQPHAAASPATSLQQQATVPNQSPAAAVAAPAPGPTAVAAPGSSSMSMPLAVATRVPSPAGLGSPAVPHIDRVIALGSRKAPHLAGTRVKIYCSQGGRGLSSRHTLSSTVGGDSSSSRRVKQKVEALDLMIWRCECARKVITKGAPIPASSLSGQDAHQPLFLVPSTSTSQVAAAETLPSSTFGGNQPPAATQLAMVNIQNQQAASSRPEGDEDGCMQYHRDPSSDEGDLIHQLPGSAPMLTQEDSALLTQIRLLPPEPQHPATLDQSAHTDASQHNVLVHPHSPSNSQPDLSPPVSRQSSPSAASLAGLIPATTAVTAPSLLQPPYNMISAARAASLHDDTVPAVVLQDAVQSNVLPACSARPDADTAAPSDHGEVPVCRPFGLVMDSLRPELLSQLPVLKGVLRAQSSIRLPSTPDSESLERHAALNREHSSFSRSTAMDKVQDGLGEGVLQRKEAFSTSGLLDLAMPTALPPGDLEPDMFAAFFEDSGASDRPDSAV